ncbi:hypothetical protein CBR_g36443 [Chara braunii]|uniref:Exostosin GT47 domain-containing protein n=1 Tax=Chara braunii TaxID=69332 RepID=A0A388LKQ5_CHABU|nr:hypothetical protein CBR_g36443 [Chara braunii]|eukprot:GBG82916.1 hypothetical protein CBR_g36443 [Chara braunii]
MTLKLGGTRWVTAVTLLSVLGIVLLTFSSYSSIHGHCTLEECRRRVHGDISRFPSNTDFAADPVERRSYRKCECNCDEVVRRRADAQAKEGRQGAGGDRVRKDSSSQLQEGATTDLSRDQRDAPVAYHPQTTVNSSSSVLSGSGKRVGGGREQLKVYVYSLPRNVNMALTLEMYNRRFSNRLYMHAAEFWIITDLTRRVEASSESRAVRVETPEEADVVLVPFLGSQSFEHCRADALNMHRFVCRNVRDEDRQEQLYQWLVEQPAFKRSGGYDHVYVASHPLALAAVRRRLRQGIFLSVDFGYYCADEVSMAKDVVIPYQHVVPSMTKEEIEQALESTTSRRRMSLVSSSRFLNASVGLGGGVGANAPGVQGTAAFVPPLSHALLYFCGEVLRHNAGIVRFKMWKLLKDEPDVLWVNTQWNDYFTPKQALEISGMRMRASEFCLSPAGDSPTSARLFDALQSLCIPVVVSDHMEYPFERGLNWSEIVIMVKESDAIKPGFLVKLLRGIGDEQRLTMRRRIAQLLPHFVYGHSWVEPRGAVNMIWEEISQKLPVIELQRKRHMRGLDSVRTLDMKEKLAEPGCKYQDDPEAEAELVQARAEFQRLKEQQQ